MIDREKLQILKRKSRESYFAGKGGGLFLYREGSPSVIVKKNDEIVYSGKTVNYVLLYRALWKSLLGGQGEESEGGYHVKTFLQENGDVVISFLNTKNNQQGAVGYSLFKKTALFEALSQLRNYVPSFTEIFETAEGKVKIVRNKERVMFPYGNTYIEMPIAERMLLKNSILHYFKQGEMKPFLATLIGAGNDKGFPYVVLGIEDYVIPVNDKETALRLLALI
jgi:hypothetical protein